MLSNVPHAEMPLQDCYGKCNGYMTTEYTPTVPMYFIGDYMDAIQLSTALIIQVPVSPVAINTIDSRIEQKFYVLKRNMKCVLLFLSKLQK